jgi:hypothetical protein
MNKYSLKQLLADEIAMTAQGPIRFAGVQVPMIQRDYAQGRKSAQAMRDRFLTALFGALTGDKPLTLDFVYGAVQLLDEESYFIPLDGQQRLTTLFLLHWYIGCRELPEDSKATLLSWLGKFSYATRRTAREFCAQLTRFQPDFATAPGKSIRNQAWFYSSYEQDPTVQAMLEMLDAIHGKYNQCGKKDLFPALSELKFYVLPLDGFGLSDELYIKMNARGKQLTEFENFKADLIDWLRRDTERRGRNELVELAGRMVPFYEAFTIKLDTTWTDLLWRVARANNTIDAAYLRFWNRFLLAMEYIEAASGPEVRALMALDNGQEKIPYPGFTWYEKRLSKPDRIRESAFLLDRFSTHYEAIRVAINGAWGEQANSWHLLSQTITQPQRILFLAVVRYLQTGVFDELMLQRWLRVIWNISADPDVRSAETMVSVMRVVEKLSKGADDIHAFLLEEECATIIAAEQSFIQGQLQEERLKAELIRQDPAWEAALVASEKHRLFQGNVGFILPQDRSLSRFHHRAAVAAELFAADGPQGVFQEQHLLLRAVISQLPNRPALERLGMADEAGNWQLMLRRKKEVYPFISSLLDLDDTQAVADFLRAAVAQPSGLYSDNQQPKWRHVHEQLFQQAALQEWMQEKGAVNLKWFADRIFVCRAGSWYDWVALDTQSNFIASEMCERLGFSSEHHIAGTRYFWGRHGITLKRKTHPEFVAELSNDGHIDLMIQAQTDDENVVLPTGAQKWQLWKRYTPVDSISTSAAIALAAEVEMDLST